MVEVRRGLGWNIRGARHYACWRLLYLAEEINNLWYYNSAEDWGGSYNITNSRKPATILSLRLALDVRIK